MEFLEKIGDELLPSQSKEVYTTLHKALGNIVKNPGEPKYRTLKKDNKKVAEILKSESAKSFLLLIGFEDQGDVYHCPAGAPLQQMEEAVEVLCGLTESFESEAVEEPAAAKTVPASVEVVAPAPAPAPAVPHPVSNTSLDSNGAKKTTKKSAFEFESREKKEKVANQANQSMEELRRLQKEKYKEYQADPEAAAKKHEASGKPPPDTDQSNGGGWGWFGWGGSSSGSGGGGGGGSNGRDDRGGPRVKTINDLPKPVRRGG